MNYSILSDSKLLEANEAFLNRLFYRSMEDEFLQQLFPNRPKLVSVLVFYAQEKVTAHVSLSSLIQCCDSCIRENGINGHIFLSGHDYFIFLMENKTLSKTELENQCKLLFNSLTESYGIKAVYHAKQLCGLDTDLCNHIQNVLTKISAYRYYGMEPKEGELQAISNVQMQKILDSVMRQCELGNLEKATDILQGAIKEAHGQHCSPMNVKRSALRIMYAFFASNNRRGEEKPYYDVPHVIIEQVIKAETWKSTEQIAEIFCKYILRSMEATTKVVPEPIKKTLEYINENYQYPIKLKEIAEFVHLNKSYLSQLFQKTMGKPYTNYLEEVRIQAAKELLKTTNKTVAEIAETVGFSSQNYFAKVFKSSVGVSPLRYRQRKV